jgi:AcrR family transcriptional regulator
VEKKVRLEPRKIPQQTRSQQLVADILTAGIRVLEKYPATLFTTILVAKEAGISVGSFYQYFPDKGAILFAIQKREWEETLTALRSIINQPAVAPLAALESMMHQFFRTEWQERNLRQSLKITTSPYQTTPQFVEMQEMAFKEFRAFLARSFPMQKKATAFWASFLLNSMTALAEEATSRVSSEKDLQVWSRHCTDMMLGYFERHLSSGAGKRS